MTALDQRTRHAPTKLERRYRLLLLAYPRRYRHSHGDELLDVLMESARPGRAVPEAREVAGLVAGGMRARVMALSSGSAWAGGVHLGVTAVSAANLAALLPYAGTIPLWVALSALSLLTILRGRVRLSLPLVLLTGVKAVSLAGGWPVLGLTLLPVYPSFLTREPLFATGNPIATASVYALTLLGLVALSARSEPAGRRSWWWWAVVPLLAWAGPAWMSDDALYPLSLSRVVAEFAVLGLAVIGGHLARDPRWGIAAAIYFLSVSTQFCAHLYLDEMALSEQHLAYWAALAVLTIAASLTSQGQRSRLTMLR
ncbi:hypothetical protein OIE66_01945 [Nonomuraea sp. NBC_01738]|uniref:hypothetical protein n=1 Tax=Nonomuraea sp. NBC_01738 TaxID=2976003 RepID=UPI002E12751F|nr:hypothetical protein OIE66_01945 [Nonomuraea sp. NBC_01738]